MTKYRVTVICGAYGAGKSECSIALARMRPAPVTPTLRNSARSVVVDLGGDPAGARVIRQFLPHLPVDATEVLYVVNQYRPETGDLPQTLASLRAIEAEIGFPCTGLISNSHMLDETTCDHIRAGLRLCREVTAETLIPRTYIAGVRYLLDSCGGPTMAAAESHLYLTGVLREDWMNTRSEPCREES